MSEISDHIFSSEKSQTSFFVECNLDKLRTDIQVLSQHRDEVDQAKLEKSLDTIQVFTDPLEFNARLTQRMLAQIDAEGVDKLDPRYVRFLNNIGHGAWNIAQLPNKLSMPNLAATTWTPQGEPLVLINVPNITIEANKQNSEEARFSAMNHLIMGAYKDEREHVLQYCQPDFLSQSKRLRNMQASLSIVGTSAYVLLSNTYFADSFGAMDPKLRFVLTSFIGVTAIPSAIQLLFYGDRDPLETGAAALSKKADVLPSLFTIEKN